MTQAELASRSQLTMATISRIENDKGARRPTKATLVALSEALGVNVFWLANGEGQFEGKMAA
jgi:transcriptional regulator with XRE-family HTH domain